MPNFEKWNQPVERQSDQIEKQTGQQPRAMGWDLYRASGAETAAYGEYW